MAVPAQDCPCRHGVSDLFLFWATQRYKESLYESESLATQTYPMILVFFVHIIVPCVAVTILYLCTSVPWRII